MLLRELKKFGQGERIDNRAFNNHVSSMPVTLLFS